MMASVIAYVLLAAIVLFALYVAMRSITQKQSPVNIVLDMFKEGWFAHLVFGDVSVGNKMTIEHQTLLVVGQTIEDLGWLYPMTIGDLKKAIQKRATEHGVEEYLNQIVKTEIEDPTLPKPIR